MKPAVQQDEKIYAHTFWLLTLVQRPLQQSPLAEHVLPAALQATQAGGPE